MSDCDPLLRQYAEKLKRALAHLRYSVRKVRRLPADPARLGEEELEAWEGFSARFARAVDLFLTKYLRAVILREDPGFDGTLRDVVDRAEKLRLIESADRWMAIRKLRNITAHEYTDEELESFFRQSRGFADEVLRIEKVLNEAR